MKLWHKKKTEEPRKEEAILNKIKERSCITDIEEKGKRPFYDITFLVTFSCGRNLSVVLSCERTLLDFLMMIDSLDDINYDSVKELDQRNSIYYD